MRHNRKIKKKIKTIIIILTIIYRKKEIKQLLIGKKYNLIFRYNFRVRILTNVISRIIVVIRNAIMKWLKISWKISK